VPQWPILCVTLSWIRLETADRYRSVWRADHLFNILCRGLHIIAGGKLLVGPHFRTGARGRVAAHDRGGFLPDNITCIKLTMQLWSSYRFDLLCTEY
jgi:hypothetical protein